MSSPLAIRGVVPASRLGQRPAASTVSTGISELDALTGGLPRGALSELCGPASSGRTSVLLSLMAETTRRGELCALVDTSDCFDPQSAEAAGAELRRVLWVRCSKNPPRRHEGTEKSIADCRLPIADYVERVGRRKSSIENRQSSMRSLEQTLKATDLLLQGGGFGLVVVDLADVPPEVAQRVPLTSWFRFRRVVENTPTVLLVLEQEPHAKSCASLVVGLSAIGRRLSGAGGVSRISTLEQEWPAHAQILHGLEICAELIRDRSQRKKPTRSVHAAWENRVAWAG